MPLAARLSVKLQALGAREGPWPRCAQLAVESGERKGATLRKLKVSSVIHCELKPIGQIQDFTPGLDIRVVICGDVQQRKIRKSGVPEVCIYATSTTPRPSGYWTTAPSSATA